MSELIKLFDIRGGQWETYIEQHRRVYSADGACPTLCSAMSSSDSASIKVAVHEEVQDS